jgi:hypothetical protein
MWQKIQSIHPPVCLDGKSVTCVARDRLRHLLPKIPPPHPAFIPCVRVFFPLSHACIWSTLSNVERSTRRLTHRDFVAELHTNNGGSFGTYQLQKAFNKGQCLFLNGKVFFFVGDLGGFVNLGFRIWGFLLMLFVKSHVFIYKLTAI